MLKFLTSDKFNCSLKALNFLDNNFLCDSVNFPRDILGLINKINDKKNKFMTAPYFGW